MQRTLVVHDGKRERELSLVQNLVVGRDPTCDISHDDALLSRRHAEFIPAADRVTVRDLGSRNGIFVNGTKTAERALQPNDVVQIGPLRVTYVVNRVAGFARDGMDFDATVVTRRPRREDAERAVPASSASPLAPESDVSVDLEDDPTRLFRPPSPPPEARLGHTPVGTAPSHPEPSGLPLETQSPQSVTPASGPQDRVLDGFVFGRLTALAVIVFAAAAIPLILVRPAADNSDRGGMGLLSWFGLSVAIALIATYSIGSIINRRFAHVLTTVRQDRHSSVRGENSSTGNSPARSQR